MKILSPHGKNVATELKGVYNLHSVDELLQRGRHYPAVPANNDMTFRDLSLFDLTDILHITYASS
jgi:hypothetical protein